MASLDPPSPTAPSAPQQAGAARRADGTSDPLSSTPVEMRTLPASTAAVAPASTDTAPPSAETPTAALADAPTPQTTESDPSKATEAAQSATPLRSRADTEAIGPSTDTPATNPDNTNGPVLVIMLLLTTGARHPYKIDEKYLKKRNVTVEAMDPYNISVYTLKELIWRDWREGMLRMTAFGLRDFSTTTLTCFCIQNGKRVPPHQAR